MERYNEEYKEIADFEIFEYSQERHNERCGRGIVKRNAPDDEVKKKNINRMKKVAAKPFDDNLI